MESSFTELHSKCVINVTDGKNLGRVCDLVFTYPEGRIVGIVVPGKTGLHWFHHNDMFIAVQNIIKIGADAVLVNLHCCKPAERGESRAQETSSSRRDYTEYE